MAFDNDTNETRGTRPLNASQSMISVRDKITASRSTDLDPDDDHHKPPHQ